MVAIRLSDFLPILKPQQGNLLACALLPDTILNTTAAHKLLKQLVNAKDDLKYFAMPIAFVCVGAVLAKNLINIGMAFRYIGTVAGLALWGAGVTQAYGW